VHVVAACQKSAAEKSISKESENDQQMIQLNLINYSASLYLADL